MKCCNCTSFLKVILAARFRLTNSVLISPSAQHKRYDAIEKWYQEGGVFLIGHRMFLSLCKQGAPLKEPLREGAEFGEQSQEQMIRERLLKGPSLVVLDEAHIVGSCIVSPAILYAKLLIFLFCRLRLWMAKQRTCLTRS